MARVKNDYDFLAGIYVDGALQFNKYRMILELGLNTDVAADQAIAFERINYFIYEIIQKSVLIGVDETAVIEKYKAAGISVLTVPEPGPYDQIVQAVICTKINAMLEANVEVTISEVSSLAGGQISYIWDIDEVEEGIHELINDEVEENWWACIEPRFETVFDLEDENVLPLIEASWESVNMHWFDEAEDAVEELNIHFPDAELPEDVDPAEIVIKMSDFNKDEG